MSPRDETPITSLPAWLRSLDSLRVKLFVAIAGANLLLVMAAYLIYGWSFDQGLVEYLNRADESRLTPLVSRLADGYRQRGDWRWLTDDRQRWQDLLREVLGVSRSGRRPPDEAGPPAPSAPAPAPTASSGPSGPPVSAPAGPAGPPSTAARPLPPLTIDPRMLLLNERREVLLGPADRAEQAVLKPIEVDGRTVGYLGYVPRVQMVASLEQIFLTQQNRRFAAIALGLFAAVLLNAALISHWLSRRLRRLRDSAAALAAGDYSARITVDSNDELAQLAADFNHLAGALEAARRARQQWIADIAHELRTPLATLRAEIEAIQDGVRPLDQRAVGSLAQEVGQLTRLVEDLRVLSLSDIGALSYHKEPGALAEVVSDALEAARPAVDDSRLIVTRDLSPGVTVVADEARLAQVVGNLLQNTLRYSEAPARLALKLRAEQGEAHLTWEDSSPGVPAADLSRLTERLFRVDGSRARASGGAGLGLAIVDAIVRAHGGAMRASASALGGLRWDIRLPLHASARHG
ncbi:MAG TPA: HAMP domain-containing protein [Burkholderiaceae bacterium]|nr:HAMP domain-containing protein [Burkholderiaceae bacterium]